MLDLLPLRSTTTASVSPNKIQQNNLSHENVLDEQWGEIAIYSNYFMRTEEQRRDVGRFCVIRSLNFKLSDILSLCCM